MPELYCDLSDLCASKKRLMCIHEQSKMASAFDERLSEKNCRNARLYESSLKLSKGNSQKTSCCFLPHMCKLQNAAQNVEKQICVVHESIFNASVVRKHKDKITWCVHVSTQTEL